MKRLVKILASVIFSLIIILAIGGYFFVRNFDLNKYKSYAEEAVANQLGRKLSINGNASLGISLVPTIIIEDVELANASWATEPQMVKVQKLELKFALLPLLKKQVIIDKAVLVGPQIFLETSKEGQNNWEFSALKTAPKVVAKSSGGWLISEAVAQETPAAPVAAENQILQNLVAKNIVIENGVVQYNNKGEMTSLNINNVTLAAPSFNENMSGRFDVVFNGEALNGDFNVGPLATLLAGNAEYPVMLNAKAFGIDLTVDGVVADLTTIPLFAANVNVYNPAGNFNAPETTLTAYVSGSAQKIDADIKLLNIVNNKIVGKVSFTQAARPLIEADLESDMINLESLNAASSPMAFEMPSLISEAQALSMVPETKVPYQALQSVNAKFNLKVGSLVINPAMTAENVSLAGALQNGVLNVAPLQLEFGGGNIKADMTVDANAETLKLKLSSQNILLQKLHKEFLVDGSGDFGVLSGGKTDVEAELSSKGQTYRQLVQNLNGLAVVMLDKSVIQTGALKFLSGNLISQVLDVLQFNSKKITNLDVNCAVIRADFVKGKAVFPKGIALSSKQLNLVSDGSINLINDGIDFTVHPYSGKLVDTNIAQALSSLVKVKGTIQSPKVTLDDAQALKAIVGVAAGGPAYLGSKLVLDADSSPCYTALKGTPYQSRYPAPGKVETAGQDMYQGAAEGVDDGIQAVKDTAKGLLNLLKDAKGKM